MSDSDDSKNQDPAPGDQVGDQASEPAGDLAASNQMWGGRFAAGPAEVMERINASIGFDQRLGTDDDIGIV